jgi:integrase/recombinase XerD
MFQINIVAMKKYNGIYGPYIKRFVNFKRSLGYKFGIEEYTLLMFDRFTIKQNQKVAGITKELADKWNQKRPNEKGSTRYKRIAIIAQFSTFLCQIGVASYISRLPKQNNTYTPYIFSSKEIESFFSSCDRIGLKCKRFDTSLCMIPAFFRLLYGTGVRLSEGLSLRNKDVNLKDRYLIVRGGKTGKDRMIPFSASLMSVFKIYYEYKRLYLGSHSAEDYFFATHKGGICPRGTAYTWFRRIMLDAGISHMGRGLGPRVHDLRHTFSVHCLARMAETGLDLYYSLPILSTYLGHKSIIATEQYVRLTSEMYPKLVLDTTGICTYIFPKNISYEAN